MMKDRARASISPATSQSIYISLRELIERGFLTPGHRLVEAELTEKLGAGRSQLREALRVLEGEGLVEVKKFKGATVRRLSPSDHLERLRTREILESYAVRCIAERPLSNAQKAMLRKVRSELNQIIRAQAWEAYPNANEHFHSYVLDNCHNRYVVDCIKRARLPLMWMRQHTGVTPDLVSTHHAETITVIEAILAGEAELAEQSMRKHMAAATARYIAFAFYAPGDRSPIRS